MLPDRTKLARKAGKRAIAVTVICYMSDTVSEYFFSTDYEFHLSVFVFRESLT
jgi:hypothetical protein